MANQVEILQLDINTTALIAKMTATRTEIDKIKAAQKDLTDTNQKSSDAYTQNEVVLKRLQTSYNQQKNVVTQLNSTTSDFVSTTDAMTSALNKEVKSIDAATENNKQLKIIRNSLNAETEEGIAAIAAINSKLDANTNFIKENTSAAEQQKMAIGGYKDQIKEAFQEMNVFNGGLAGFSQRATEAGGVMPLLQTGIAGVTSGIVGATRAAILFIATPLGAAIAAIAAVVAIVVGAFKFMTTSMNSTEEGSQKLARVTATVSGIFRGLFNVLKPLGEFMGKVFIAHFDAAIAIAEKGARIISGALKLIGANSAAAGLDSFTNSVKAGAKAAGELSTAESKLTVEQRKSEKLQLDYQNRAEKLRQVRDDESKSIAQRQKANEDLGLTLKKQSQEELKIANLASTVADLNVKAYGKTTEALNKKAEAQTKISEVNERITSQESEQLVNINSLRKESADKAKEQAATVAAARQAASDKAIQKNQEEITLFIAQQGFRKKTQEESLAFEEQITQKKIAILDAELAAKKISQTKYDSEKLTLSNDLLKKQADAAVINADKELADFNSKNKTLLDSKKYLNDELVALEIDRLNKVSEAEAAAATAKLVAGQLSSTEYNDAIKVIDDTYAAGKVATEAARVETKIATDAINLENQRAIDVENLTTQAEIDTFNLNTKYQAELAAADKNGADKTLITQKYSDLQAKIDEGVQQSKIAAAGATFGVVADLLGKESAAGKAAALAQALINTYQGITAGVKLGYPMAIPAVAMASATGFAAVKNITSAKVPTRAEGGEIPTLRSGIINNGSNLSIPLSNGDDTLAYVGQGEMILNKQQQARAGGPRFFQSIGVPSYATGGYVSKSSSFNNQKNFSIDYNQLAQSIATANLSLPAPVVSVVDISRTQNQVRVIENYANLQ